MIESAPRLGGKVETCLTHEACFEFGPNSFGNQPDDIFQLLEILDLKNEVLPPSPSASHRYILKKGKMVRLPAKPQEIFTTSALSIKGRLRFLRELFYVPAKKVAEESIWGFFTRHFGREVADYFADPFISGIFAGDSRKISLAAAFPTMAAAEANHTSLLRYLIKQKKSRQASPQSYQMKQGLESIFHRAAEKIGQHRLHLSERVTDIIPGDEAMTLMTDRGTYRAKILYLTTPAYMAAGILRKNFPTISQILEEIEYAPVATIHLKVPKSELFPFDGFGMLLPSLENRRILGVLWNSSTFPELFPDPQYHYLTVYVGGARHPELLQSETATIQQIVSDEVQNLFHLQNPPTWVQMRRHPQAIPQYTLGYEKILQALREGLACYPALKLAGNYLGGISMPKTVAYAARLVE